MRSQRRGRTRRSSPSSTRPTRSRRSTTRTATPRRSSSRWARSSRRRPRSTRPRRRARSSPTSRASTTARRGSRRAYACATPIEYDWCGATWEAPSARPCERTAHELVDGVPRCRGGRRRRRVTPPATYTDGDGNRLSGTRRSRRRASPAPSTALTLIDMGVDPAQNLIGTFGERATSGSNVDRHAKPANLADHGDHAAAPSTVALPHRPVARREGAARQHVRRRQHVLGKTTTTAASSTAIMDANGWPDVIIASAPLRRRAWIIENKPEVVAGAAARASGPRFFRSHPSSRTRRRCGIRRDRRGLRDARDAQKGAGRRHRGGDGAPRVGRGGVLRERRQLEALRQQGGRRARRTRRPRRR